MPYLTAPSAAKPHSPLPEANRVIPVLLWEGGLRYAISYGEQPWHRGVILSLSRAVGSKSTQEQSVSMIHLENLIFSIQLVHSTISELWAYMQCSFHLMFKVLLICYTKSAMNVGPLSNPMLVGNPNLGTLSLSRHEATFDTLSIQVGKASTHPNVHTMIRNEW